MFKDLYVEGTSYNLHDTVLSGGIVYISLADNNTTAPLVGNWLPLEEYNKALRETSITYSLLEKMGGN